MLISFSQTTAAWLVVNSWLTLSTDIVNCTTYHLYWTMIVTLLHVNPLVRESLVCPHFIPQFKIGPGMDFGLFTTLVTSTNSLLFW